MSNYYLSDAESDEDVHAIEEALERNTLSNRNQVPAVQDVHAAQEALKRNKESNRNQVHVVVMKPRNQVRRSESDCPCEHYPNCPYRQETERMKRLNKSCELELRANKIRIDLLTEANEEMKISMNELKTMILVNKADGEKRERESREKITKLEQESREKITKLEQDIIEIKNKME